MLKILATQAQRFAAERRAAFVGEVRPRLRRKHPERTAPMREDELTRVIHRGITAARSYEIVAEEDVIRYLDLMFALGLDFDREVAWARETLSRPDFTGRIRIDLLCATHEGRIPDAGPFFP